MNGSVLEEERQDLQTTDDFITRVLEKIQRKKKRSVYRRENKRTKQINLESNLGL